MNPDELFDTSDLTWLQGRDSTVENAVVERKTSLQRGEVAKAISAFANGPATSGGLIVVGSSSEGNLPGLDREHAQSTALNQVLDHLAHQPVIRSTTRQLPGTDKVLLFIRVFYSPNRVIALQDGTAFIRVQGATRRLKPEEVVEYRYLRGETDFELEPAEPLDTSHLEPDLCADLQRSLEARAPGTGNPLEVDLVNSQLAVERKDGRHLTYAGALVLARDPRPFVSGAVLRLLRFDGVSEDAGVIQDREFVGPIPHVIRDALQFAEPLVRRFKFRLQDGSFADLPEYPPEAWHEAIVNAVVHRSYSLRHQQVEVKLFDDRLEVHSPGGLFGVVTSERLNAEDNVPSNPRNRVIMRALLEMKTHRVQLRAEGNRTMRRRMRERGLPFPEWREDELRQRVVVTLRNDYEQVKALQKNGKAVDWKDVLHNLQDEQFAVYRSKALRDLAQWIGKGTTPPADVVEALFEHLFSVEVPAGERDAASQLLASLPRELVERPLLARLDRLLTTQPTLSQEALHRLAEIAQDGDSAVERLLEWLRTAQQGTWFQLNPEAEDPRTRIAEWCFQVLRLRLGRDPLLPREALGRLLEEARRWSAIKEAQVVYAKITGKPLR